MRLPRVRVVIRPGFFIGMAFAWASIMALGMVFPDGWKDDDIAAVVVQFLAAQMVMFMFVRAVLGVVVERRTLRDMSALDVEVTT